MVTVKLRKIWKGTVSVRDYIVNDCINAGEPLRIVCNKGSMVLSTEDLKNKKFQVTKRKFQSKFNSSQSYFLIDFQWKPMRGLFD